jgi:hypothetical protein
MELDLLIVLDGQRISVKNHSAAGAGRQLWPEQVTELAELIRQLERQAPR